jgi:phosphoribosylformimino-5-aminoimidazole carboxamide ribotide isomerase
MEIIPAIDIIEGKCVRLTHGDFNQKKVYDEDPLEVAKRFQDHGLLRLHLVDLEGAGAGAVKNWKVLERIAGKTSLIIDFGGGIKSQKEVSIVFDSGAAFVNVGSMAVTDEEEFLTWLKIFEPSKFFLGADVKDEKICIHGWKKQTEIWLFDFIEKYLQHGIVNIVCTDIAKDGALQGPSTALYKNITERFGNVGLIASGGVSSMDDLYALKETGVKGAIIGKALYEGNISLKDLSKLPANEFS